MYLEWQECGGIPYLEIIQEPTIEEIVDLTELENEPNSETENEDSEDEF